MQSINTKIQIVINERIRSKQRIVISDVCIANNLYRWAKLQKFPFDGFEWRNDKSNFDEKFVKILMKIVTKDTYLKSMLVF